MACAFWSIVKLDNFPPKPLDIVGGTALRYFLNVPCSIVIVAPNGLEFTLKVEKRGQRFFITEGWSNCFSSLKVLLFNRIFFVHIEKRKFSVIILLDSLVTDKITNCHGHDVLDLAINNPGICIAATKLTMVGFVVANFPCFFEFGKIRIPKKFNKLYGPIIPNDIVLIIDNGDRWFYKYDHMSCRIVGLQNFMEFYGVDMYWFLVMTYFGNDEFGVNIFSPKGCEIFYPKVLHVDVKIEEKHMVDFKAPPKDSINEEKNGALFVFNVSWSDFSFFRLVIRPVHLNKEYDKVPICEGMYRIFKNWNNGERITMWLFNKCWEVEIEWCNYYCMFGLGWSKFVEDVDIQIGDSCIFECTGNRLEFNICIERDEDHDFFIVNPDLYGVKFFQIVFCQSLDEDKIVLPIALWNSLGKVLSGVVEFVMPSNRTWSIRYERNCSSFVFIKEFATFYGLKENFLITFEYRGHSSFFVRIFDKSCLEISYFKLCKTLKRDNIFSKSKYQFGFAKGNLIDVIRFRNTKGIVKDYVEMLDKFYDDSSLLSLWKGRHIFGRFVIVLGCSSIDHKLLNVYSGNFARSLSKDWSNGSVSRLLAHKRQWRVLIKVMHNKVKLGSGWDIFVRDNALGEGDVCIFNLLNCIRNIFRVDVIRV